MAITVLPKQSNPIDRFSEAINPYLLAAFQKNLEQKFQEQQRQKNIEQAQTMFPNAFTETPSQYADTSMGQIPVRPESPKIPKQYQFNMDKAKEYPGLGMNFKTGEVEYKVPSTSPTIGIYASDQSGNITKTGDVPRGARVLTPSQLETPEMKQRREVETANQKKAQEVSSEVKSIDNMIGQVWKQADALIPAKDENIQSATLTGLGRKAGTTIPGRILGMGDQNAIAFSEFQEGTLSMLIRSLGEKGVLTNQDIARARQFEPSFYDTPRQREIKKQAMGDFLKSKVSAYTENQSMQPTQPNSQSVPEIGQSFNGEKVVNVRRIE